MLLHHVALVACFHIITTLAIPFPESSQPAVDCDDISKFTEDVSNRSNDGNILTRW